MQDYLEIGGYRLAWVGLAEQDEEKTVRPVGCAGFEEGYLGSVNISWADTETGQGPTGQAIRTGQTSIVKNMATDPTYAPWREEASAARLCLFHCPASPGKREGHGRAEYLRDRTGCL